MGPLFVVMTLIEVWLVWSIVGLIHLTITKQSRRPSNVISFVAGGAFFGFVSLLFYGVMYTGLAGPEPLSGGWLLGFFLTVGVATVTGSILGVRSMARIRLKSSGRFDTAGRSGEESPRPVDASQRKGNLYALLVGEMIFCVLGPPVGAFIFWVLIGVTMSGEGVLRGLLDGIGGSPVAIIFGFIPGVPISAIVGLVFWRLIAVPRFRSHIRLSGMASGAIVLGRPALVWVISKLSGHPRDTMYALQMAAAWLSTGALTGLIVPPIAWRFMRKHIGEKHDETPASTRADA